MSKDQKTEKSFYLLFRQDQNQDKNRKFRIF